MSPGQRRTGKNRTTGALAGNLNMYLVLGLNTVDALQQYPITVLFITVPRLHLIWHFCSAFLKTSPVDVRRCRHFGPTEVGIGGCTEIL